MFCHGESPIGKTLDRFNYQYLSHNKFEVVTLKEWYKNSESVFNHLITSLKNIAFEVIRKNVGTILY